MENGIKIQKMVDEGRNLVNGGKIHEAVVHYQKAIEFAHQAVEKKWEGYFYQQLGVAQNLLGESDQAIDSVVEAEKIFREINDFYDQAAANRDLGIIKIKQGKFEEAIDWLNISLDLFLTHTQDWNQVGVTEGKLALCHLESGKLNDARKHFSSAVDNINRLGDWFMLSTTLLDFAKLEIEEKRFDEAVTKLWASAGLILDSGQQQSRRLAEIYGLLGKVAGLQGVQELEQRMFEKQKQHLDLLDEIVRKEILEKTK